MFLWVANLWGLTAGFTCLPTLSQTFIAGYICLTKNITIPNTRIFHFFFLLCDRETHFGRCSILLSSPSNIKHSVDLPCTHDIPLNTKHCVDLYHALTSMSCDVPCINAMSLHVSHATCTMNATCNNKIHTSCQVSWIILFNTYNLHPFNSRCLSHIF